MYAKVVQVYCKWVEDKRNEHFHLKWEESIENDCIGREQEREWVGVRKSEGSNDGVEELEMEFSQLIEPLISMEMNLICFYGFAI